MSKADISPCPLCGGSAKSYTERKNGGIRWLIRCDVCDLSTAAIHSSEQGVIDFWNNRSLERHKVRGAVREFVQSINRHLKPSDWGTPDERWLPEREIGSLVASIAAKFEED